MICSTVWANRNNIKRLTEKMYRLIPNQFFVVAIVWLTMGFMFALPALSQWLKFDFRISIIPIFVWSLLNLLLWKPVWRFVWRLFPVLSKWFPDLNGKWKVTLCSNWSRQEQMLETSRSGDFDMRSAAKEDLAPLQSAEFQAEIDQTWWKVEMKLRNPLQNTPIKQSDSIYIEPCPGSGLRQPTIMYFFKQTNQTDNVSDDIEFYGSARLEYDADKDRLDGTFWTARMWRRAMNTAGTVVFTRLG